MSPVSTLKSSIRSCNLQAIFDVKESDNDIVFQYLCITRASFTDINIVRMWWLHASISVYNSIKLFHGASNNASSGTGYQKAVLFSYGLLQTDIDIWDYQPKLKQIFIWLMNAVDAIAIIAKKELYNKTMQG